MANSCKPKTVVGTMATIQAELDRITSEFGKSLHKCREAAEFLMTGAERQNTEAKKSKVQQVRFDL